MLRHGYTYSGHATACAIGNANLDVLEREGLVERVGAMEGKFADSLAQLGQPGLVRRFGRGSDLGAVEIDPAVRGPRIRSSWARWSGRRGNAA